MRPALRSALAGIVALAATMPSHAVTPQFDTWYLFDASQDMEGSPWMGEDLVPLAFEFVLDQPAILKVVDVGLAGDRFEVFSNGVSLGLTSLPGDAGDTSLELDFDAAYADPLWSRGAYVLGAGSHVVTGQAVAFAPGVFATSGGLMLAAVPEPSTWALIGTGALLVAGARRRVAR